MTEFDLSKQGDKKYTMQDVEVVLDRLLAPDGCPWDREQTHESIRQNMIEEAYEAVDAIDSGDKSRFTDELGDVLLQVLLHCGIAEKNDSFSLLDVTDALCRKLISRHTHVFGEETASSGEESLAVWNRNKIKEKGLQNFSETLTDIPEGLPSLLRAEKIQSRASKAGFDWDNASGAMEKIEEELGEVKEVLERANGTINGKIEQTKDPELFSRLEDELGDFLFSAVNYIRLLGVEPEVALRRSNQKFIRRFQKMEKAAVEKGLDFAALSFAEKDIIWDEVKEEDKKHEIG